MGIKINLYNDEIVIKGNKKDLMELANYIKMVATSNNNKDHLHLDEMTLLDSNSSIKSLIIEKDD